MARSGIQGCIVPGCPYPSASHLGACQGHWQALPRERRDAWWQAWHDDGRAKSWGAVRKDCLAFWATRAP